jgi:hypothetical protein
MPPGYSGRTENGALITWAVHAWITHGAPIMDVCIIFYRQNGNPVHVINTGYTLTDTKTEYQVQSYTPGDSYFIRACLTFQGDAPRDAMTQIDTARLGVE